MPIHLLALPEELLRHVASFLDDLEHGPFAMACKANRAIVQAHRHGVVLSLRSRRPSQREFLHAFGLTLAEVAPLYSAPRIKQARVYDLKLCLPLALKIKGGWGGVKDAHLKQAEAVARKRKREEAAAAERAARRMRVTAALRRAEVADSLDDFERRVQACGIEMPASFEAYLRSKKSFDDVFLDLVQVAQKTQRKNEVEDWLCVLPASSSLARARPSCEVISA